MSKRLQREDYEAGESIIYLMIQKIVERDEINGMMGYIFSGCR